MEYNTRQANNSGKKSEFEQRDAEEEKKDKNCESHLLPTVFIDFDFLLSLNYEQWQC